MLGRSLFNFSSSNFFKGTGYLQKIERIEGNSESQLFKVKGTSFYRVFLKLIDHDVLAAHCSCPMFDTVDECKHVAACILYLEGSPFSKQFANKVFYEGSAPLSFLEMGYGSQTSNVSNQLKHVVNLMKLSAPEKNEEVFPVEVKKTSIGQLWYKLDFNYFGSSDGRLKISFRTNTILKNGKLGKFKEKKIRFSDFNQIENPEDQGIINELIPYADIDPYRGQLAFSGAFIGSEGIEILKKILRTGRAFLDDYSGDDYTLLRFVESSTIRTKIKTNMEKMAMLFSVWLDDKEITNTGKINILVNFNLATYMDKVCYFETHIPKDMFLHLAQRKEIKFTANEWDELKDSLLEGLDHRAICGDYFGLPVNEIEAPFEVLLKLPLGDERVMARLMLNMPAQNPPFTSLVIPNDSRYQLIKDELEKVASTKIDVNGLFSIQIEKFQKTISRAMELEVLVKAEKAIIKSANDFNISIVHDVNWFEVSGEVSLGDKTYNLPEVLKYLKEGSSFIEFKKGELTYVPQSWLEKAKKISEMAEYEDGKYVVHVSRAQQLESLEVPSTELGKYLHKIRSYQSLKSISPAKKFKGELRDYQRFGLSWMHFLREMELGGCLADDMGLGKTVQVAANLQLRKYERKSKVLSLVVCPKSLVFNWFNELSKFAPDIKVKVHESGVINLDEIKEEVVITTYGLLQRYCEKFHEYEFDYIVLDEAQAIKNPRSLTSKAIFTLRGQHRLALTGTPVENHIGELYSIFNFLMPGVYKREAMNPNHANKTLARDLRPFILRRTKQQVLKDLPDKVEQIVYCEQKPEEQKYYEELRNFVVANLNKKVDLEDFKKSSIMVLEALTRLRQASCHPGLTNPKLTDVPTGKLEQLQIMLEEILQEGHKVVVFSQFTSLLKLTRDKLGFDDKNSVYMDGGSTKREEIVSDFQQNDSKKVFFLSLKAGGTGLNLVEASYCFLLDPWWNPAVEEQAIARLHRMGQKKSVNVYRLITKGSIEEKVMELQKLKKEMVSDVLDENSEGFIRSLTSKELEFLLR